MSNVWRVIKPEEFKPWQRNYQVTFEPDQLIEPDLTPRGDPDYEGAVFFTTPDAEDSFFISTEEWDEAVTSRAIMSAGIPDDIPSPAQIVRDQPADRPATRPRKHCDWCGRDYLTEVVTARQVAVRFTQCPWCDGSMERAGIPDDVPSPTQVGRDQRLLAERNREAEESNFAERMRRHQQEPVSDVHTEHCCAHPACGCKYSNPKCTVVTGEMKQSFEHKSTSVCYDWDDVRGYAIEHETLKAGRAGMDIKEGTPELRLFAFWKYDLFPYVLGAEIVDMEDDGHITARGYEGFGLFRPLKILPLEVGQQLLEKVKSLKKEHRKAEIDLQTEFKERLVKVLGFDPLD